MQPIPLYRPHLGGNVSTYVQECIETGWISSRGPFVERFEQAFARYVKADGAVSVSNGTVALHLALVALGIGPGDEVIVPSLTYVASVNTILQTGARPIPVDSSVTTLQVDPDAVRGAITSRTKAIMAVHIYGHPCDMNAIVEICTQHGLLLVEDCAEGFGTLWKGRHVGTFGDAATFSFYGNKTITTGEGGMVLARDPQLLERCRHLKSQAMSPNRTYWHEEVGYNYRMTNIQAAIGLAQIEIADRLVERKLRLGEIYRARLQGLPLRTHDPIGDVRHSYWMCSIIVDYPEDRDALRGYLSERGIETRPFFASTHLMPHVGAGWTLPVAERLSMTGINLPSYPDLADDEIDHITNVIHAYFGSRQLH